MAITGTPVPYNYSFAYMDLHSTDHVPIFTESECDCECLQSLRLAVLGYIHIIWRRNVFGILSRTMDNVAECKQMFYWKAAKIRTQECPRGGHAAVESLEPLFLYPITYQCIEVCGCMWCSCERASWGVRLLRQTTSVSFFNSWLLEPLYCLLLSPWHAAWTWRKIETLAPSVGTTVHC
jgi:hypothetical protein